MVGKASLIFVIGFSIIMGYIMMNLAGLGTRATENVSWYNAATISKNLATIGANVGLSMVYQDPTITEPVLTQQNISSGPYTGGSLTVRWNHATKLLRSVSEYPNPSGGLIRDTVEVSLRPITSQSFSVFAWMVNYEASNIWWISGERVYGRFHSNTDLRVAGSPEFFGKVTVSGRFIPSPGHSSGNASNNGIYHQGYESGVAQIEWPDDLSELYFQANNPAPNHYGKYYDEDAIWIELDQGTAANGDGRAIVRTVTGNTNPTDNNPLDNPVQPGTPIDTVYLGDANFNGVIGGKKRIYVEGTLSGRLTIASFQEDIYIADHIKYQNETASQYDDDIKTHVDVVQGDDMLGLVSARSVRVKTFKKDNSKFTNPVIHASIFALGDNSYHTPQNNRETEQYPGGFGAQHWKSQGARGNLNVLGSLVNERRSPVGSYTGNQQIQNGYAKQYMYDIRLRDPNVRPPYYPGFYDTTLKITNWYESIQHPPF